MTDVEPAQREMLRLTRREQREATRAALLQVAVTLLVEQGVGRVTTLEVQHRANVSRGALLHHFPTRAALLSATVAELVRRNEAALWREQANISTGEDDLGRAIRTLAAAASTPSYLAEMELWAVSRTDDALREMLRGAEREALQARERVLEGLFASIRHEAGYRVVASLSIEFARGLALSNILREDPRQSAPLVDAWIAAAKGIIERARDPQGARS